MYNMNVITESSSRLAFATFWQGCQEGEGKGGNLPWAEDSRTIMIFYALIMTKLYCKYSCTFIFSDCCLPTMHENEPF